MVGQSIAGIQPRTVTGWHCIAGLGDVVEQGLARCVGVSNHSIRQMRNAHTILARRGIPLSFNQVQYSMIYNNPEQNGMLDAIRELDMVLMAYSPLQSGLLTGAGSTGTMNLSTAALCHAPHPPTASCFTAGKYSSTKLPSGPRGQIYAPLLAKIDPVLDTMRSIGAAHGNKSCTQVASRMCTSSLLHVTD